MERIQYLLQQFGNPHQNYPCVHIAGTNGKGTVTYLVSQALTDAGYKVGKFTSPHLHDYTERIQIDGVFIPYVKMNEYLDQIETCVPKMVDLGLSHPTEFEILTTMAFIYFKECQVDLAVLEVGMGGTWDSTNVIIPIVSVITGIDYDHMNILGNTLAEIAANKAGIIKEKIPVVIGEIPEEAMQVIYETAEKKQALIFRSQEYTVIKEKGEMSGQILHIQGFSPEWDQKEIYFHLLGSYQRKNLATALKVLDVLHCEGYLLPLNSLEKTLALIELPGRLEIVSKSPLVVLDVAHNPQGIKALRESLKELFPYQKKVLVCAILDDKDAEEMLSNLAENTREVIFTKPSGPRGEKWKRLSLLWRKLFPQIPVFEEDEIEKAIRKACADIQSAEYLLVTGSFYLMDLARRFFIQDQEK